MKNKWCIPALVFFVACNTQPSPPFTSADSMQMVYQMQKKVNTIAIQLYKDCDSTLLQEAQYKVDSIRKKKTFVKRKKR